MSDFQKFVDKNQNEFVIHSKVVEQLEDDNNPLHVSHKNRPQCPQRTVHREEFEQVVEGCVVYAELTTLHNNKKDRSVWFGYIWGQTPKVYLGIGSPDEIKERAKSYNNELF